jgi:hypothetical protein
MNRRQKRSRTHSGAAFGSVLYLKLSDPRNLRSLRKKSAETGFKKFLSPFVGDSEIFASISDSQK